MTVPAINFSPLDGPPPSLVSHSPFTARAKNLGLHLSGLHGDIHSSAPDIHGNNPDELFGTMKSAAEKFAGIAALHAPRSMLASSLNSMPESHQSEAQSLPRSLQVNLNIPRHLKSTAFSSFLFVSMPD